MSHKIWQFHTDWHQSLSKRKPSQSGWNHLWVEIIIPCQCNHSRSILNDICWYTIYQSATSGIQIA